MAQVKLKTTAKLKKATIEVTKVTPIEEATAKLPELVIRQQKWKASETATKLLKKELDEVASVVLDLVDGVTPSTEKVELTDGEYGVTISGRTQNREVIDTNDVIIALEEVKEGLALELAKFGLGELDTYLGKVMMETLCKINEGSRSIKF